MGIEPPFIYDHPSKYTFAHPTNKSFNPKAVSQASLAPPVQRPKEDGPLINSKEFNRHPDSYFVVYVRATWDPTGKEQTLTLPTVRMETSTGSL